MDLATTNYEGVSVSSHVSFASSCASWRFLASCGLEVVHDDSVEGMHFCCCFVDLRDVKKVSIMLLCLTDHLLPFRKCTTWFCIMFIPMPWLRFAANCGKMSSHRFVA